MDAQQQVIFELQQYLRNIAKVFKNIEQVVPDGIYGEKTRSAVRTFQGQHNIKPTGTVDFDTWKKIIEENEKAVFINSLPVQVTPIKNEDLPLKKGDNNTFVQTLKLMLNNVASKFLNFSQLGSDSVFDEKTETEVKRWQGIIAVPETGVVDKETWNMLSEYYLLKEEKLNKITV